MDLFSEIFPIIGREIVTFIDANSYWCLQQVSSVVRGVTNYVLPPLRAKHKFSRLVTQTTSRHREYKCVLPTGEQNGISRTIWNYGIERVEFFMCGTMLFSYSIDNSKNKTPGEYTVERHGGSDYEKKSPISLSCEHGYAEDDLEEQHPRFFNTIVVSTDDYEITWDDRTNFVGATVGRTGDGFALNCRIETDSVRIILSEKPLSHGYHCKIQTNKLMATMWYYESQFYSIYKSEEFHNAVGAINSLMSENEMRVALRSLAYRYNWKYLEGTTFILALE